MSVSLLHAFWTVLLFAIFIGIAVWAYLGRNKARFEAASRIPLEDDDSSEVAPRDPVSSPSRGDT